ncbi:MAG: PIN domain-containing protein [SAR324 cluster bacterium]|nr:PIN domain-containing protein [SAR324 cluster bacterium]
MIYIDTHVVVWLYAGLTEQLSEQAKELINEHEIYISTVVRLELQYLYEIKRITDDSNTIVSDLTTRLGLKVCDKTFNAVIGQALQVTWTRDPFDRMITANAALDKNILLTRDQNILVNYSNARW